MVVEFPSSDFMSNTFHFVGTTFLGDELVGDFLNRRLMACALLRVSLLVLHMGGVGLVVLDITD